MKILLCSEFYYPSIGGAQEVVRQIAERFVMWGHDVTVATSAVSSRKENIYKGVKIAEFKISGNRVLGFSGDINEYQNFLEDESFEYYLFYAAQQWTFDAAWDVLGRIKGIKLFVPCGYSGLYSRKFKQYFLELPAILKKFDCIIYHAEKYRDVSFGAEHGINNGILIPNGADIEEFNVPIDKSFKDLLGIGPDSLILLTVGSLTGYKGHKEIIRAYEKIDLNGRKSTLILNGNIPFPIKNFITWRVIFNAIKDGSIFHSIKKIILSAIRVNYSESILKDIVGRIKKINVDPNNNKRVILIDLPRRELIQAYLNSDLFIFASNVEYSPLVLFEACAAGLPYLTGPVGNAVEIVDWTGGGEIISATTATAGLLKYDIQQLARDIERILSNKERLEKLKCYGREAISSRYNWEKIAKDYENLFFQLDKKHNKFREMRQKIHSC